MLRKFNFYLSIVFKASESELLGAFLTYSTACTSFAYFSIEFANCMLLRATTLAASLPFDRVWKHGRSAKDYKS